MPIYEFRCHACRQHVEVWLRSSIDPAMCPQWEASLEEKLLSSPFVMSREKRPAGQTCCGRDDRCDTPYCSADGTCHRC